MSDRMLPVAIWTTIPSHHQAAFLAALRESGIDLRVNYYQSVSPDRVAMGWEAHPPLLEWESQISEIPSALDAIPDWRNRIHIVPGYGSRVTRELVKILCREEVAWVHWSEQAHPGWRWWASYPWKRSHARRINRQGLGAFAIGALAMRDFVSWGVSRERICMLPYVVAPGDRLAPPDRACEDFCAGRFAFVFSGSLCRRKAVDVLLEAFAQAVDSSRDAVLLVVGDDRSGGAYARQAASLGIRDRVLFRDPVKAARISSVLRCASVLVLPSRFDGWGVVLNEGASVGLALIGSDAAGGAHHLIDPGENGYWVRAGDVASLACAMRAYLQAPGLAARHGAHSLTVFEQFTPQRNAQRFIHAIQSWRAMRGR